MNILTKAVSILARSLGMTDPRLYHFFSGGPTYAGENVTVDTSLQLDVVWSCVRLVSDTIATLPLFVYKRDKDGRGIIDDTHPLYRILHDRPNADMTAVEFWTAMVSAILLWGNAYAAIERLGNRIVAITPLRPDRVMVRRQPDGSLIYTYSYLGSSATLNEDDVFHIKGFSLDGMIGIPPITQARQSLASAMAAEKAAGAFFRNGMRPSAVMEAPTYLTDPQREQARGIIDRFSGAMNTGGVPLMEGGWKLNTGVSLPPEDAQLLQTRGFHVEQMCRWFMVPPPMIGHMEKSTAWGTGLEQMLLWFLMFSLRPHLERIEQAISKSLLTTKEQLSYYAEFNVDGILRADSTIRAGLYKTMIAYGLATPNEIRALENMPPDPDGNDLMIMSNMMPLKYAGEFVRGRAPKPLDPNADFNQPTPADAGAEGDANA
jgi:HK97 family phage portal protein